MAKPKRQIVAGRTTFLAAGADFHLGTGQALPSAPHLGGALPHPTFPKEP
jgi:hypothetical protein